MADRNCPVSLVYLPPFTFYCTRCSERAEILETTTQRLTAYCGRCNAFRYWVAREI